MPEQSYATHRRYVPPFHFLLSALIVLGFVGSLVNLYKSLGDPHRLYNAALVSLLFLCAGMLFYYARAFPLKAQDRAIRAEENLRHYVLTGELLDPRLDIRQIIGLRFAADDEFVELAARSIEEDLSENAIKRSIRAWRADVYRV